VSFASDIKEELVRIEPVCKHCNKATLSALVRIDGTIFLSGEGKYRVEIATDFASVGRFIVNMLHSLYNLTTEISYRRSVLHHTQNYRIDLPYQKNIAFALKDLGILENDNSLNNTISKRIVPNECCKISYLRGAFLGSGFIADPISNFHFELSVSTEELASDISSHMEELDIKSRIVKRRNSWVVYMKSAKEINKFLTIVGAKNSLVTLQDVLEYKLDRNNSNRFVNAFMANQNRVTNASYEQLACIHKILMKKELQNIPPALKEFIKLRVENPDASLKELGQMCDPPLSKSAINHRARRIKELSKED
jgi:cell division protein WhiA